MPPEDMKALASRIEHTQATAMRELAREALPVAGGWMTFGGKGAFVNKACALGLAGPVSAAEVERVCAFFASRHVQPQVEVCPYVHPTLLAALGAAGFQLREFENVFVRRLEKGERPRRALPFGWPDGLDVQPVDKGDAEGVEEYVRLSSHGFFPAGTSPSADFLAAARRACLLPHYDAYLARFGGRAVGAGGCATWSGFTALFGTSVLEEFRGRGVQQALVATRLERALALGSGLAAIVSHPNVATARNALRLGFALGYARVLLVRPGTGLEASL